MDSADRHSWYPGFAVLPTVVRRDAVRTVVRGGHAIFRASLDVTSYHELPFTPGWRPIRRDSLVVSWFDGFVGPAVTLRRDGARWRGHVSYRYRLHDRPWPRSLCA